MKPAETLFYSKNPVLTLGEDLCLESQKSQYPPALRTDNTKSENVSETSPLSAQSERGDV